MTISVCEFYSHQKSHGAASANRLLFHWLSDDSKRASLYADMIQNQCALHFDSNVVNRDDAAPPDGVDMDWADGLRKYGQKAVLLAHPDHIEAALKDTSGAYSNTPYRGLGGFFMLSLDDATAHDYQRDFALKALMSVEDFQYDALATLAFKAGSLVGLKSESFDLVAMAENIAVRYVTMVFGFAQKDLPLVEACTRKIGKGLHYQNMSRHFVFDPAVMPDCRQAVVALASRATQIMQLFVEDEHLSRTQLLEKEEINSDLERIQKYRFHKGSAPAALGNQSLDLKDFEQLIHWAATQKFMRNGNEEFGLTEKGLLLAGLVGGAVTNIQNAICICLAQFLQEAAPQRQALQDAAYTLYQTDHDAKWNASDLLLDRVKEALRLNPPAAFIPRRATREIDLNPKDKLCCSAAFAPPNTIPKDTLIILGMGGAAWLKKGQCPVGHVGNQFRNEITAGELTKAALPTGSETNSACPFAKVFGGSPLTPVQTLPADPEPPYVSPLGNGVRWEYTHSCPGMMMSMNMIYYAVRQLLLLPGLSQKIDSNTSKPYGLEKFGGLQSTYFPLIYQREKLLVQTPLQTVLPIKAPVDVYSKQLRDVLKWGAPLIEKIIGDANHVHFASFMFTDNDSKLSLYTMYDGDFDAYIGHFAREFGHLFDRFFSCMAVQPPMPIREHPFEFVQYLKQFVRPPVEGYYFSAYPEATTSQIRYEFDKKRKYDLNLVRGG